MFNAIGGINWLGVLVAAAASFLIGGAWFMGLFPKQYARALGKEHAPKQKPALIFLAGPFVCNLVVAAATAILVRMLWIDSMRDAVSFGAFLGLGFLAATTVNTGINPNIPRPLLYGLVSGAYFFISSIVVTVILVALR